MIIKIHKIQDGRSMLAICDDDLIGKRFEEKNLQLDLSSNFYKGEKRKEDEAIGLIKGACIVNAVGKNSVNLLLKIGAARNEDIIKVKNIPHVQAITG